MYILTENTNGQQRKHHYPTKVGAMRAARKCGKYRPGQNTNVIGVYYENGHSATDEFKPGFEDGLRKILAKWS